MSEISEHYYEHQVCKFFQRLKCDHGPVDSILNSYLNIGQECNAGRKKGSTFHA